MNDEEDDDLVDEAWVDERDKLLDGKGCSPF
jgi:hypothetical protein